MDRYEMTEHLLVTKQIAVSDLDVTIYDLQLDGIRRLEDAEVVARKAVENLVNDGYVVRADARGVEYIEVA